MTTVLALVTAIAIVSGLLASRRRPALRWLGVSLAVLLLVYVVWLLMMIVLVGQDMPQ